MDRACFKFRITYIKQIFVSQLTSLREALSFAERKQELSQGLDMVSHYKL